jgi:small conductance mechanosensitive channel
VDFNTEQLTAMGTEWGIKIVLALLIFIIGKWVAKKVAAFTSKLLQKADVDPTLDKFLCNIVYTLLLAAVILAALDSLGIPVTSLLAILGAAGLAVGLALKDSLGNFAAGVMLIIFRPFKQGDFVEVAGVSGVVNEIKIFSTILTTGDNKLVIIPNGQVGADTITNYSALDQRRVDLVFGVGYDDDLKVTRQVLTDICARHPLVLDDPATNIFVVNLGDSSVDFACRPWCKTSDYWKVYGDILETAKVELEAAGLNIPYPQSDVHLHTQNPLKDLFGD